MRAAILCRANYYMDCVSSSKGVWRSVPRRSQTDPLFCLVNLVGCSLATGRCLSESQKGSSPISILIKLSLIPLEKT